MRELNIFEKIVVWFKSLFINEKIPSVRAEDAIKSFRKS